jgi:arylsulfatase A-like enzyme
VGRILKSLDELKLADNTVVIFTSDNGGLSTREGPLTPATSNAPLRAGKGYLYEGGIREPLLVRWPAKVKSGSTCREPVSSIDLYPTVLAIAGVRSAEKQIVDGMSLLPLLEGNSESLDRDALYWHYPHFSNQGGRPGAAIRAGRYKLIEFYEDGTLELYDLEEDLGETSNLANKHPDKARKLQGKLAAWRDQVQANMPKTNPKYKP